MNNFRHSPTHVRFDRLIDRLANGGVIPFLGAGVSHNAHNACSPDFQPRLDNMAKAVRRALQEKLDNSPKHDFWADTYRPLLISKCGKSITRDIDFEWLAEAHQRAFGQQHLCETLRIREFARLTPTRAHRYIALLAREGLIDEIITTNYDTCIEQAIADTLDSHSAGGEYCHPITTLDEYRSYGGKRWRRNPVRSSPTLRLYKLNGCAKRYAENPKKYADAILLTEHQLQSHDDNPWKADLLRDRCRSHNLLLSGFGSEEPQVRHLFIRLQKEFTRLNTDAASMEDILRQPNAPFIAAYTEASFTQRQLMDTYLEGAESQSGAPDNIFDQQDAECLNETGDPQPLDADLFWQRTYLAAFKRLIQKRLAPGSRFDLWLAAATPHCAAWRGYLLNHLYPPCSPATDDNEKQHKQRWLDHCFGVHRKLLIYPDGEPPSAPIPIMRLLRLMQGRSVSDPRENNWYIPINEDPLPLLALLLFLSLFDPEKDSIEKACLDPCYQNPGQQPRGAAICLPPIDKACEPTGASRQPHSTPRLVYLCDARHQTAPQQTSVKPPARLVLRIIIPGAERPGAERRWRHVEKAPGPGEIGHITFGREHDICFSSLITRLGAPPASTDEQQCQYQRRLGKELLAIDNQWRDHRARWRLQRLPSPPQTDFEQ